MKNHRIAVAVLATVCAAGLAAGPASAVKVVKTRGGTQFSANQYLAQTNRFAPTMTWVKPGGWVRWEDRDFTAEPHTVMAVKASHLPKTVSEIFQCPICDLWKQHLNDPNDESSGIKTMKVRVGKDGFQTEGDSLLLMNRANTAARVRAPAGSTIHYMCAFHPWMQGMIHVTRSGMPPMGGGM